LKGEPSKGDRVSDEHWTESEFFEQLARAIRETRAFLPRGLMDRALVELEDVEARLRNQELLDETYLNSLAFHIIAIREVETADGERDEYIDLLCDISTYLKAGWFLIIEDGVPVLRSKFSEN